MYMEQEGEKIQQVKKNRLDVTIKKHYKKG